MLSKLETLNKVRSMFKSISIEAIEKVIEQIIERGDTEKEYIHPEVLAIGLSELKRKQEKLSINANNH